MKKLLAGLIVFFFLIGGQGLLLGALYKIQSWEMPIIGGVTIDVLVVGVVFLGIGLNLMLLRSNWYETGREDRLELEEDRLKKTKQPIALNDDEELML